MRHTLARRAKMMVRRPNRPGNAIKAASAEAAASSPPSATAVAAAGVAAMGLEKIDFIWYLKKISLLALVGYLAGAAAYLTQHALLGQIVE